MSDPDRTVLLEAYGHARWLRTIGGPLGTSDRMLADLGCYVGQLLAALEKGQENCDHVYADIKAERDAAKTALRETTSQLSLYAKELDSASLALIEENKRLLNS